MKILVACEESQAVTKELRVLGHDAYSCDIIECSGGHPEWHIMQDVIPLLNGNCTFTTCDKEEHVIDGKWDMIIAFPPCTYLTNAGARHLYKGGILNQERYEKGLEAKKFFLKFWNAPCERIAIENPTPSRVYELPEKTQVIQPWQFGHPFTKRTQLWLKGLPQLQPTDIVEPERTWCPSGSYSGKHGEKHRGMFTTDRAKNRSKTFPGIAKAMAEQWAGNENKNEKENKQMELKINDYQLPKIDFNFDELKQEVEKTIADYANIVYSDDQMKEAKQDVAKLRKFVKAMSDERIRIKKDYLKPCDEFESKVKELTGIVDKAISSIDSQIKSCEEKQKQEKLEKIKEYWNSIEKEGLDWIELKAIYSEKWLNASVSMKSIQEEINNKLVQIVSDLATLSDLPEFGFEAVELYKSTLDVNKAITEAHRMSEMAKAKAAHEAEMKAKAEEQARLAAEAEAKKQYETPVIEEIPTPAPEGFMNPPVEEEPAKQWLSFSALLSVADAQALANLFAARGIEYKQI